MQKSKNIIDEASTKYDIQVGTDNALSYHINEPTTDNPQPTTHNRQPNLHRRNTDKKPSNQREEDNDSRECHGDADKLPVALMLMEWIDEVSGGEPYYQTDEKQVSKEVHIITIPRQCQLKQQPQDEIQRDGNSHK